MLQTLRTFRSCHNYLHILWKNFRQPKCNVRFSSCFIVNKQIDSFNYYHDFMVNLLRTKNYQLLFDLCTAYIEPVGKELSDVFFKKINILLKFECLSEFDYNAIKGVKVVSIVTAITCEMHDWKYFFFFKLSLIVCLLPIYQNGFYSTSRLCFEYKRFVWLTVIFDIRGNFMNVFLLSWKEPFLFVILQSAFART